ncbi:MAG: MoaD/ThiS family protein [Candidatus Eremiobacteraeota bacterium]|nr:MoaD/ThiS family protein [Candidatus Eremiobacteraeota bacterium]
MNVRVRTFARIRELLNFDVRTIDVPKGASAESVWQLISEGLPDASTMCRSLRFARNGSVVEADAQLEDGDELAVLPPSSGG